MNLAEKQLSQNGTNLVQIQLIEIWKNRDSFVNKL